MPAEVARPVIVAGVDGSEDSKEALRWAVRQASVTGAEVHAVSAWQVPLTIWVVPSYTEENYYHDAAETLGKAVLDALGPDPGVPVIPRPGTDKTLQFQPITGGISQHRRFRCIRRWSPQKLAPVPARSDGDAK